jgi:hypothetical protein
MSSQTIQTLNEESSAVVKFRESMNRAIGEYNETGNIAEKIELFGLQWEWYVRGNNNQYSLECQVAYDHPTLTGEDGKPLSQWIGEDTDNVRGAMIIVPKKQGSMFTGEFYYGVNFFYRNGDFFNGVRDALYGYKSLHAVNKQAVRHPFKALGNPVVQGEMREAARKMVAAKNEEQQHKIVTVVTGADGSEVVISYTQVSIGKFGLYVNVSNKGAVVVHSANGGENYTVLNLIGGRPDHLDTVLRNDATTLVLELSAYVAVGDELLTVRELFKGKGFTNDACRDWFYQNMAELISQALRHGPMRAAVTPAMLHPEYIRCEYTGPRIGGNSTEQLQPPATLQVANAIPQVSDALNLA